MNKEIQDYIITYYLNLMSAEEKLAYKHAHSTLKLDGSENLEKMQRIYLKTGWLTKDQTVLRLLNNGLEKFNENTATRILRDHYLDIVFNYCPKCHKLARTPSAKQCRFCFHDWHKEDNNMNNCDL